MNYVHLSNEQLLVLLQQGDKKAFQVIFKLYWKYCYAIAFQKLNSKILAEEATQNIFISLWERRETAAIQNLQAYLTTSVKYQAINFIEAKLVTQKHIPALAKGKTTIHNNVEDTINYKELMIALEKAIQNLPPKTGEIYRLSRYNYLSGKEIAERMGLSEKSVEYHISQALKFLRLELQDYRVVSSGIILLSTIL
ncbi:MAG: RNA polymerase sigma-70 factor [Saprospiraceae bacterium]